MTPSERVPAAVVDHPIPGRWGRYAADWLDMR